MHTKDLLLNHCSQAYVVEDVCAISPNVERSVLAQTFIVKPVDLGDLPRLVVPPNSILYPIQKAYKVMRSG